MIIEQLVTELYNGQHPIDAAQPEWIDTGYPHTYLPIELINAVLRMVRPTCWLEIGSAVGNSAIRTAEAICAQRLQTQVVCLDPFTGDVNSWAWETRPPAGWTWSSLGLERGRLTIFERFLANVSAAGYRDRVLPIPVTSTIGLRLLRRLYDEGRISTLPKVIYLDSAHEEGEVFLELSLAWDLLPRGSILLGDDWDWPAVRGDVIKFAETIDINFNRGRRLHEVLPNDAETLNSGVTLYRGQWIMMKR